MTPRNERRAARLVLLYPRQWRRRYPDFIEALAAELAEHPRGVRRDVVRAAAAERLRAAGVLPTNPGDRARSGFALVYASLLPFVGLSAGMWSQFRDPSRGAGPSFGALHAADLLLAVGTVLALASLIVGVPLIAYGACRRSRARDGAPGYRPLGAPALCFGAAMAVLSLGGWAADHSGWYSPAAAALPAGGLGHELTLWARGIIAAITPAWVHPGLFGHMPAGDLLATLSAPFAVVAAGGALLILIVRLPVSAPRRANTVVAVISLGAMFLSAAATARWLLEDARTPLLSPAHRLAPGHTPWVVGLALVMLAVAAAVGARRVLTSRAAPGAT